MERIKSILWIIAPDRNCKPVLKPAVALVEKNQASLTVIFMIEHLTVIIEILASDATPTELQAIVMREYEQQTASMVEPYRKKISIEIKILQGIPFLEIVRQVLRCKHNLVIKMVEEQSWLNRLLGSDDMHLLRKCPCPVLLIQLEAPEAYRCILAAVDASDDYPQQELQTRRTLNQKILEIAGTLALSKFAALHIVHVWDVPQVRIP
ncbi:MAG TPA: universal stress protein [Nitrosomonas nitrosa]|nr:universal stress protein [Nitrosomonas nitrosa]